MFLLDPAVQKSLWSLRTHFVVVRVICWNHYNNKSQWHKLFQNSNRAEFKKKITFGIKSLNILCATIHNFTPNKIFNYGISPNLLVDGICFISKCEYLVNTFGHKYFVFGRSSTKSATVSGAVSAFTKMPQREASPIDLAARWVDSFDETFSLEECLLWLCLLCMPSLHDLTALELMQMKS